MFNIIEKASLAGSILAGSALAVSLGAMVIEAGNGSLPDLCLGLLFMALPNITLRMMAD